MQCEYVYDYGYDYEHAPIESCEEFIIEDISSAADCADLCYDDWDCANWDFVEDEMKCVHKQFVSYDNSIIFIRKKLIFTLFSFSV